MFKADCPQLLGEERLVAPLLKIECPKWVVTGSLNQRLPFDLCFYIPLPLGVGWEKEMELSNLTVNAITWSVSAHPCQSTYEEEVFEGSLDAAENSFSSLSRQMADLSPLHSGAPDVIHQIKDFLCYSMDVLADDACIAPF